MYVLTLPRSLQMREERHSTEWQYTSESVNFGIDSLRMYYCCSVCLFVVCVCVCGGSMRAHPPASIFYPFGCVVYQILWIDSKVVSLPERKQPRKRY
jgi:hypothetical protein